MDKNLFCELRDRSGIIMTKKKEAACVHVCSCSARQKKGEKTDRKRTTTRQKKNQVLVGMNKTEPAISHGDQSIIL